MTLLRVLSAALRPWGRWGVVVLYAMAMAWVESAVVFYLRTMVGRLDPYQADPLPIASGLAKAELIRDAATLVMLATVGWLAGCNFRTRFAYFLVGFGVWDIFYYVWLRPLTNWPRGWLDWDVLFLIPLPWWGPVLAPCLIAALMVVFGTVVTRAGAGQGTLWPRWPAILGCGGGVLLALYVFMADALRVASEGPLALRRMLPTYFNWPLFSLALALMTLPVLDLFRRPRAGRPEQPRWSWHRP
jgi:hypothetical protein